MLRLGVTALVATGGRRPAMQQLALATLKRSISHTASLQYARCTSAVCTWLSLSLRLYVAVLVIVTYELCLCMLIDK